MALEIINQSTVSTQPTKKRRLSIFSRIGKSKPLRRILLSKRLSHSTRSISEDQSGKTEQMQQEITIASSSFTPPSLEVRQEQQEMQCRDKINRLLQATNNDFTLDEHGVAQIMFCNVPIACKVEGKMFSIYSCIQNLGELKPLDATEWIQQALQLNYMEQATRGGCISLKGEELALNYMHPICATNQEELENILFHFVETLEDVKETMCKY